MIINPHVVGQRHEKYFPPDDMPTWNLFHKCKAMTSLLACIRERIAAPAQDVSELKVHRRNKEQRLLRPVVAGQHLMNANRDHM